MNDTRDVLLSFAPVSGAISYRIYSGLTAVRDWRLVRLRRRHSHSRKMRVVRIMHKPVLIGEVKA